MSEDRDLMMEHRLLSVLRNSATAKPLLTAQVAEAVNVRMDNARRLLDELEARGAVCRLVRHVGKPPVPADAWILGMNAETVTADDLRGCLADMAVGFDLPDGWTLLPPWTETAEWDLLYEAEFRGSGNPTWQVCTMPGKRHAFTFLMTDIPHPDDPHEACVFEFDMDQAVRLIGLDMAAQLEEASE